MRCNRQAYQWARFTDNNILIIPAVQRVDNFSAHLSYVATLPENTLATECTQCFLVDGWFEKTMDDATNWRPTNSSIP